MNNSLQKFDIETKITATWLKKIYLEFNNLQLESDLR